MPEPIIEFSKVTLRYQNSKAILHNVNFKLKTPSFHFITGASGAGKTSILNLITMENKPSNGEIKFFGKNTTSLANKQITDIRRKIGIVFQDYRLLQHLTSAENIAMPLRVQNYPQQKIESTVENIIEWIGLKDKINLYPQQLSGGECQRIAIARAVINKPILLLADEPTGNIDDANAITITYLLEEMYKLGTSVLFATHNYQLVQSYNFPVLHISNGTMHYFQNPKDINFKEANIFT